MTTSATDSLSMKTTQLYINGEWRDGANGDTYDVINPATEETLATIAYGTRDDAKDALKAAASALKPWQKKTVYERAEILKRVADLMREHCDYLAVALTMEQGKPLAESKGEIMASAATFEWYAEEAKRAYGRTIPASAAHKRIFTVRHPVGVVAAVSPWNFPIVLQARKLAPALAVGCTTVSRPASQTPLSLIRLFELFEQAGLPTGTVNCVPGPATELMEEFMTNRICRKISFTGSTEVGKDLIRQSGEQVKRLSLELGGHAPVIVFPDVDIEAVAKAAVIGKFRNNGQVCICPTRFYAQKKVESDFVEACIEETKKLVLGNGMDPNVNIGPMFEMRGVEKTEVLVQDAVSKGAVCATGGARPSEFDRGFFYEPTVLTNISPEMNLMTEEPFAPIMPIMDFDNIDEVIEKANDTVYGLAAYVLTNDMSVAFKMSEGLEFGTIGINDTVPAVPQAPFGGLKESGLGRENGYEGMDVYLETKTVSFAMMD